MKDEASYQCDSCGEEILVPIDLTAGSRQEYVEDCPVCCRPNVIQVEIDDDGDVRVWAEREQVLAAMGTVAEKRSAPSGNRGQAGHFCFHQESTLIGSCT